MVVGDVAVGTEVLVIGGGPGGYVAAIRAAQLGKDVTLVEKDALGGTCLQRGCIPSKTIINAADLLEKIENAKDMGLKVSGVQVDGKKLQAWKQSVVKKLTMGVESLCKANSITVLSGIAQFENPNTVRVETEHGAHSVNFKKCIIATGSIPIAIPGFDVDQKVILDSTGALDLDHVPKKMIVLGGGYIGLEIGTAFAQLGSKVTVVEGTPTLLPGTDPALVSVVQKRLEKMGVEILLEKMAKSVKKSAGGVEVKLESNGKSSIVKGDVLLVAVGRRPFTVGLDLEKAGVQLNEKGFIPVNQECRTNVEHIFAIGDVAGQPMLAHKASRDGMVAAEVICGEKSAADQVVCPAVIFTSPEIAYVGMTKAQAEEAGHEVSLGKFPLAASGRALSMGESDGFVQVVVEKESNFILGVQMVGPHVSELIGEATLAIEMGAVVDDLSLTIHPHPTISESLKEAVESVFGKAIHTPPKK